MKAIHPLDNILNAVGYTSKGDKLEFDCNDGFLFCYDEDLVSLDIPEGVEKVWCSYNKLTELNIPESVKKLRCDRNIKGLENVDWDCDIFLY